MRRAEEQQRQPQNDGYHPSDAAHHPPGQPLSANHLPPMQASAAPMQGVVHGSPVQNAPPAPPSKEYPAAEERPAPEQAPPVRSAAPSEPERAARKMDVDEDYDDSGEDEKKVPAATTNGSGPAPAAGETKPPTSGSVNGSLGPQPKVEST
ncbi:hypothetical protein HYQ44_017445 [Verticillium longisporum]|nr:hypothetical protein HYQ44_017445 [Verticillium longisporum]